MSSDMREEKTEGLRNETGEEPSGSSTLVAQEGGHHLTKILFSVRTWFNETSGSFHTILH
jgi:hypothetical protein